MNTSSVVALPRSPIVLPPASARSKATHLSLQAALRRTLAFDVPLPGAARVDLVETGEDAWVAARDADLRAALAQLLAHAIRQSPLARRIEVVVRAEHPGATVTVRDEAPGFGSQPTDSGLVAVGADARLFEPELALLQACARRLGARVLLAGADRLHGIAPAARRVVLSVQFPPPFNVVARDA